jgi:predicted nucleic acid-binding protein
MIRRVHVDANVILRFLRNDDPQQSAQAANLFRRSRDDGQLELIVSAVTLMEVFYVLVRTYALPRPQAARLLLDLLNTGALSSPDHLALQRSLGRITSQKISFGDAWIAGSAAAENAEIATFDQELGNSAGVKRYPLG